MNADNYSRKRPITTTELLEYKPAHTCGSYDEFGTTLLTFENRPPSGKRRRPIAHQQIHTMPVDQTITILPPYPSFMSVFGSSTGIVSGNNTPQGSWQHHAPDSDQTKSVSDGQPDPPAGLMLARRRSSNSLMSESTESSPTNTTSTFDSPSVTEESPNSSPESPTSSMPLSTKKPPSQPLSSVQSMADPIPQHAYQTPDNGSSTLGLSKNVKNLSLNVTETISIRPSSSPTPETSHPLSEPSSPLREPLRSSRRKPPNLTIRTPASDHFTFNRPTPDIPSTPAARPPIQNNQSSPALPSLLSPTTSTTFTHLPVPNLSNDHSRAESQSSWSSHSIGTSLGDVKEEDLPQSSQEVHEKGYVDGPVLIYDTGVYLYLEPTVDEACKFDTVINVAKEIRNPFEKGLNPDQTVMSIWRRPAGRTTISEPQTAISERSFKSAFEWPENERTAMAMFTEEVETPPQGHQPEYLHVPWDHNSEIINDLLPLCKFIDDRIQTGRTVLIHCQLGVSRSASLVIAYGLYKGYQSSFPDMYDAVKARSKWVGPNMSLIYQLGDFRKQLQRGDTAKRSATIPDWYRNPGRKPDLGDVSTPKNAPVVGSSLGTVPIADTPPTATDPTSAKRALLRLDKDLPPLPTYDIETPSKALPVPDAKRNALQLLEAASEYPPLPPPHPLPLRERFAVQAEIPPHRPRQGPSGIMIPGYGAEMDLASQDVPTTPSLFSPRATEFIASPFGATLAGELHVLGRTDGQQRARAADPRSPPQPDPSGEILRHIDDFL